MHLPSISSANLEKSARDNVWALTGLVLISALLVTFVLWMNTDSSIYSAIFFGNLNCLV